MPSHIWCMLSYPSQFGMLINTVYYDELPIFRLFMGRLITFEIN